MLQREENASHKNNLRISKANAERQEMPWAGWFVCLFLRNDTNDMRMRRHCEGAAGKQGEIPNRLHEQNLVGRIARGSLLLAAC